VTQHVVFRLADGLPSEVVARIEGDLRHLPMRWKNLERRRRIDEALDAGHGSCLLRDRAAATLVQDALLHFDGSRYWLPAWVVMPNHVHVLLQTRPGHTLPRIINSWKSFTGRRLALLSTSQPAPGAVESPGSSGAPGSSPALGSPRSRAALDGAGSSPPPRIWHRDYFDRYIRSDEHFNAVVRYIHGNPVKAGLGRRAEDWPWSSAGVRGEQGWGQGGRR
jgi:REP element-mobilizing transposase RayT